MKMMTLTTDGRPVVTPDSMQECNDKRCIDRENKGRILIVCDNCRDRKACMMES